jgi:hypothetical protein
MNNKQLLFLAGAGLAVWYFFFRKPDEGGGKTGLTLTPKPAVSNAVNGVVPSTRSNPYLQQAGANRTLQQGSGSGNGFDATGAASALVKGIASLFNKPKTNTPNNGSSEPWNDPKINPNDRVSSIGLPGYVDYGPPVSGAGPAYDPSTVYQFGAYNPGNLNTDWTGTPIADPAYEPDPNVYQFGAVRTEPDVDWTGTLEP